MNLVLFLAATVTPAAPAPNSANIVGGYGDAAKAVEDCIASADRFSIDQKKLSKLGWKKAKLGGSMAALKGIITPYVHDTAPLMLVSSISCIVKFNIGAADAAPLADFLSQRLSAQSVKTDKGAWAWATPKAKIEFTPGATAAAQASIVVTLSFGSRTVED